MKKFGALLAAFVVAGSLAACSGDTRNYDFSGRWDYEERQLSSNCRMTIGAIGSMLITQEGTKIEVMIAPVAQDGGHAFGTCDPVAGTLSFNWANSNGGVTIMEGAAVTPTTLSGTSYHTSGDGCFANTAWTATFLGR